MDSDADRNGMADDLPAEEGRALRVNAGQTLDNVRTVLVEPREPGNIGAAARALKGMGLWDFWLVHPLCDWRHSSEARKFAMNSQDVLSGAKEVDTLDGALDGVQYVVGTTHRRRVRRVAQPMAARSAATEVIRLTHDHRVAVLFGREDFGLSNDDLARCNMIVSVPMATKNPPLNLAQAVQVWAYELFVASLEDVDGPSYRLAERRDVEALQDRIILLLEQVDFRPPNEDWDAIRTPVARVLGRTALEQRDLEVVMKICRDVETFIRRNCQRP